MENSEPPQTVAGTRIPKAPAFVSMMSKSLNLQSPIETKLPMITSTTKIAKLQTTTPSPTSNQTHSLIPPTLGTGTKLRRANSLLVDSNITKLNATTSEPKLRRAKTSLTETKRPKSQILMSGTKLPKLQPNASETKTSKIGSLNLTLLEAKGWKIPKMAATTDSKLPRIQPLNLPLKEINADAAAVGLRRASLGNSRNIEALNLSTEQTTVSEPVKVHPTSLPAKVSKTAETDSSPKTVGAETKATPSKAPTSGTAKKLPKKALPLSNTLPRSSKIASSATAETSSLKGQTKTTGVERRLPKKAQLTLPGLKSPTPPDSKLPKIPTTSDECKLPESKVLKTPSTPDDSKLPRVPEAGVTSNTAETRRQRPAFRL